MNYRRIVDRRFVGYIRTSRSSSVDQRLIYMPLIRLWNLWHSRRCQSLGRYLFQTRIESWKDGQSSKQEIATTPVSNLLSSEQATSSWDQKVAIWRTLSRTHRFLVVAPNAKKLAVMLWSGATREISVSNCHNVILKPKQQRLLHTNLWWSRNRYAGIGLSVQALEIQTQQK